MRLNELVLKLECCVNHATITMLHLRKAQVDWKSVDGAFAKPRQLHLAKGSDGLDHCPVTAVTMQDLQVKEGVANM